MKSHVVKLLIRIYPASWRARYGGEFRSLLEKQPATLGVLINIIGCALYERVCLLGDNLLKVVKSSITLILFAGVATLTACANLYFMVDDSPIAAAMQAHSSLTACWLAMVAGSILAIAGLVVSGVPVFWAMVRFAWIGRRMDIGLRLAFAVGALTAPLLWIFVVVARTHWAPLPWAVTGDWLVPANWPTLEVRWQLCWVTLALLAGAFVSSAMSLRQARTLIRSSPQTHALPALKWPLLHRMPTFALAACMAPVCALAGAAVGGVLADSYSPGASQARIGFLASTASISWLASISLLVGAAAAALRGFQCADSSLTQPTQ